MKALERLILAAGVCTVVYLLWRFDPRQIWGMVSQVGVVGFAAIIAFQLCDHFLNALGWRMAFAPEWAARTTLWSLIKARVAGDGVNYLTPSGQIAGELVRPGMLGPAIPDDVKNGSVVVAKFAQAMAQALFILFGMIFVLTGKLNFLEGRQRALGLGAALLIISLVGIGLWVLTAETEAPAFFGRFKGFEGIREQMRLSIRGRPLRYGLSVFFFMVGYAWGGFECLLICRFMSVPMPVVTAFAMEILSNVIDSMAFMVPGKVGTQEAGKTAIFHGLGYPGSVGLAFGLIRHTREVLWASAGLGLYAVSRRKVPAPTPATP
jgi:hypothetical protein